MGPLAHIYQPATVQVASNPSARFSFLPIWLHFPLDVLLLLQVQCHSSFQFLAVLKTLKPTLTALQVRPRVAGQA